MTSLRLKLALGVALLALLPGAVAFYELERLARRSETSRVDARLESGLRAAVTAYTERLDGAQRTATELGRDPRLRQALQARSRTELAAFVRRHAFLAIVTPNLTLGVSPKVAARRSVDIFDRGRILGQVVVVVPINGGFLRKLRSPPGLEPVALAAPADLAAAEGTARWILVALVVALLAFALVAALVARSSVRKLRQLTDAANAVARGDLQRRVDVRGRDEVAQLAAAFNWMTTQLEQRMAGLEDERHRLRASTARVGQALEATHDVDQLLRAIVEAAVEVTGASGGVVVRGGREVVRSGDPESGSEKITFTLRTSEDDFGSLVLAAPHFENDQVERAGALASNAAIALENARLHEIVERQAAVDPLTGLSNRRALEQTLHAEVARAIRFGDAVCLVFADLDNFKAINDRYGHPCGDDVLREFAHALDETVREIDVAGRWGGEEFALILPGTDAAGGAAVAERARAAIEAREIRSRSGDPLPVTASFGVAAFPDGRSAGALVAAADQALYRAKREGKNRVVTSVQRSRL